MEVAILEMVEESSHLEVQGAAGAVVVAA